MKIYFSFRRQNGLSLVELLVATVAALLLMAGMVQIFVGNRQSYRVQEALSRVQENGRFALMFMEQDIRMADYQGCGTRSEKLDLNNTLSSTYIQDYETGIEGYEATGSSTWNRTPDSTDIPSPLGGSDILTIRRASGEAFKVITHGGGTLNVVLNSGASIDDGDIVMVADCEGAEVFEVDTAVAGVLTHSVDLNRDYVGADAFQFDTVSYFIRTSLDSGRPGLWQKIGSAAAQELIEGVEEMQVVYGEDTDADDLVERYVAANAVADWDNVISVSINLLMSTLEDNLSLSGPQAYIFNGVTIDGVDHPGDNRLRRSFSSTVTLRNRTL